jgi:anti-sigma B factor antagonist
VLTVQRRDDPAAVTLSPRGEIDPDTVPALDEGVAAALADGTTRPIVMDLSGVRFIDSAGIAALLRARRGGDAVGREFRVAAARPFVAEVLRLTGVWDLLTGGTA